MINLLSNKPSMRFNALLTFSFILFFSFISYSQDCGNDFDLKKLKKDDPARYQEFLRIEKLTEEYRRKMASNPNVRLIDENGVITIPIVFHVLHLGEAVGTGTNLSDARLIDQIAILNQCYSQTNDQAQIPQVFRNVAGNPNFRFVLACRDPNGNVTNGIVRKQTTNQSFTQGSQNAKQTSLGGDDPWATERYLNVWITPNLSSIRGTLFGYAQFPAFFAQNPNTDGVVVVFDALGIGAGTAPSRTQGRTLVHEIGHWLNIIHTYDDENGCNGDDMCADTPPQAQRTDNQLACSNIVFPRNANVCANSPNGDMFDNFMDNTNESCGRRMFTADQVTRMRAVFQVGGPRRSFVDNYFKLVFSGFRNCIEEFDFVASPFCEAAGNINWSITGPAYVSNSSGFSTYVNPWNGADGQAILTASWNNMTTDLAVPVGWGFQNSTYKFNSNSTPVNINSGGYYPAGNSTSGIISFTGATGAGTNWRTISQYGQASFSGFLNSFNVSVGQGSNITIAVDFPTLCGTRTAIYVFARSGGIYQYALSPNPASNNLTVKGTTQTAVTARNFTYDVEIISPTSQVVKIKKNISSEQDTNIDISNLAPNQFYTIRFINNNEVEVQRFFKG